MQATLDEYLDGLLNAAQRTAFEARFATDAFVQPAIEAQAAIDTALSRLFTPTSCERILSRVFEQAPMSVATAKAPPALARPRRWLMAALLAFAVAGAWWNFGTMFSKPEDRYPPQPWRSLETVYQESVRQAMQPSWVCKSNDEFATYFRHATGERILLAQTPSNVKVFGLSHCNCITPSTIYLLAEVDGSPVVVFADRGNRDNGQSIAQTSGLNLFQRRLEGAVLYELTPLDRPALLDLFVIEGVPGAPLPSGDPSRWERDAAENKKQSNPATP